MGVKWSESGVFIRLKIWRMFPQDDYASNRQQNTHVTCRLTHDIKNKKDRRFTKPYLYLDRRKILGELRVRVHGFRCPNKTFTLVLRSWWVEDKDDGGLDCSPRNMALAIAITAFVQ